MTPIEQDAPAAARKWFVATAREIVVETPRVKTIVLDVPGWPGHFPGQHVQIRLTAEDGYQAQRDYSIASPPEDEGLALTVELVEGGEASDYLVHELRPGDKFGLRGPIGRHFVWSVAEGGPLFLIGGGSGLVPLMSMLRHRKRQASKVPAALLYSSRTFEDIIYRAELEALAADPALKLTVTLTRGAPAGWPGPTRRIDKAMLQEAGFGPETMPQIFICGSNSIVESVSGHLAELGHMPAPIKTERFGPSG
ncbi:MAG: ferredoxin reductase [Rhodomicrobium sp.]